MRTDERIRLAGRMDGTVDAMATRTPKRGLFLVMLLGVTLLTGCGGLFSGAGGGAGGGNKPPAPNLGGGPPPAPRPKPKPPVIPGVDPQRVQAAMNNGFTQEQIEAGRRDTEVNGPESALGAARVNGSDWLTLGPPSNPATDCEANDRIWNGFRCEKPSYPQ